MKASCLASHTSDNNLPLPPARSSRRFGRERARVWEGRSWRSHDGRGHQNDSHGRLQQTTQGTRTWLTGYDANGYGSKTNVPDYMVTSGGTYRILSDHLGSPRAVVDVSSGNLIETINFDEFGNETDTLAGTLPTGYVRIPFGFAGGLYDPDTGLVRFGARDYDASVGRWASKDPILFDGGSMNLYGYVLNDPVNEFDPLGKNDTGILGGVCCNDSNSTEYAVYDKSSSWAGRLGLAPRGSPSCVTQSLAPGQCTSGFTDCDGMTCNGQFHKIGNSSFFDCDPGGGSLSPPGDGPGVPAGPGWSPCQPSGDSPDSICGKGQAIPSSYPWGCSCQ